MEYKIYTERLKYLKELIEKERLSSPSELAPKFECSEKTIRNMISYLRDTGLKIKYSRKRSVYFIENNQTEK